jgi:hypothetical protein
MILLSEHTIVIALLPSLIRMAKAVSSTVELVNSVTSNSINPFYFAMWAFTSKSFPIELVPCSDRWLRTWWSSIHIMPGLPVFWLPQCKSNHNEGACRKSFPAICRCESAFFEAYQTLNMIGKGWSLKSSIKRCSCLEEIITSRKVVLKNFQFDIAVKITKLGNSTRKTDKSNVTVIQTPGSSILTPQLQAKHSDL